VVCHCENPAAEVFSFPRNDDAATLLQARRGTKLAAPLPRKMFNPFKPYMGK
jgi:hypothetical protein